MLSNLIKKFRLSLDWTQVQLAKKLNITKHTVLNREDDNIQPSIEMLIKLTKVFNVSSDYLLGIKNETHINVKMKNV